ncbi:hypothetical protein A1O7_08765 [Cladophialophora yegresii CBS 114405]|uniref:Uncharacterized protein n=1 Tax=Cladophialophora yegresii CBS 114405 TaxID=1182544 RepID=W9WBE0_9EURO|nr:uncharacterized protein A1O7_08765 [Cladophialophora yegresii CBS 114405]EXJ55834.1 hypothetical protein A1O7_08765 [Cladophialophora yegresii CBS 114405]
MTARRRKRGSLSGEEDGAIILAKTTIDPIGTMARLHTARAARRSNNSFPLNRVPRDRIVHPHHRTDPKYYR